MNTDSKWLSVKEYAALKGISERAVQKAIAKGKHITKEMPHPSRKDQVSFLIWTGEPLANLKSDEPTGEPLDWRTTGEPTDEPTGEPLANHKSGEPTDEPEATTTVNQGDHITEVGKMVEGDQFADDSKMMEGDHQKEERRKKKEESLSGIPSGDGELLDSSLRWNDGGGTSNTETAGSTPAGKIEKGKSCVIDYVPYHKMDEAQLYALAMEAIQARLREADSKSTEWIKITEDYNGMALVPELRRLKGPRSERALRLWYQKWQDSDRDMFELVHKNTAMVKGRKVTYLEQRFLEASLLCGHEKPIMTAIRELKAQAAMGVLESPSSVATLKRWIRDYAEDNPAIWTQARRGDKAVKDTVVKSIHRDDTSIKPLQVYVVDGHKLSVFVKHPLTGKAFRPTLIMIYDWGSRYPVGMSLALTEDSSYTLAAVRNALLNGEVIPPFFYLDNGKAFRSALFNKAWEEHDLEKEFAGIFPKLGIEAHFARAYNARAKVVERFFKTMQDQWESRQKSYCGRNIASKPAMMSRNETYMQEMFGADAMEYTECMNSIYEWIRYEYGMTVHQGINAKPYEVFSQAERPENRRVDPQKLNFLMLTAERKQLRKEGIVLYKNLYWDKELVNHVGKKVVIRYDYADLRSILVYDEQSRFICQAELRESQSAWVFAEMDNPLAAQRLWAEDREIGGIHRRIRRDTKKVVNIAKRAVDREIAKHQDLISERQEEVKQNNRSFVNPPMIPAPKPKREISQEIAELERIAQAKDPSRPAEIIPETTPISTDAPKIIRLEDLLDDEGKDLAGVTTFEEMKKIIGIER